MVEAEIMHIHIYINICMCACIYIYAYTFVYILLLWIFNDIVYYTHSIYYIMYNIHIIITVIIGLLTWYVCIN